MSAPTSAQQLRDVLECPKGFGAVVECPNDDDFPFQATALGQSGMSLSALRVPIPRNSLRTIGDGLECPKGFHARQLP